jgi:protein O-GlcNAcase/histone acetyltransferase
MPISTAPLRGYIEGFYGQLLSWPDRTRLLDKLQLRGMNSYFYAPKEDIRHRLVWREPYDAAWRAAFSEFCAQARARQIFVIAGIAPGLDFDFAQLDGGEDFQQLFDKAQLHLADGAAHIALLMDDIDEDFHHRGASYASEGEAHASLANQLSAALGQAVFVVPRAYANDIAQSSPNYLADFADTLEQPNPVFLCGSNIVAKTVKPADFLRYAADMKNRVITWDNLYANDYCPRRLFVGPWAGRQAVSDIMLNPTGYIETDLLLLDMMAACGDVEASSDSGDITEVWQAVMVANGVPAEFFCVAPYFNLPPFYGDDPAVAVDSQRTLLEALDVLLWKWKSPLSREWYPHLTGLKHDLLLASNELPVERIYKTQTLPLATMLDAHKRMIPGPEG